MAHAIHLLNQLHEFFFVLIITIPKSVTRKLNTSYIQTLYVISVSMEKIMRQLKAQNSPIEVHLDLAIIEVKLSQPDVPAAYVLAEWPPKCWT